jgi:hypothetical protein
VIDNADFVFNCPYTFSEGFPAPTISAAPGHRARSDPRPAVPRKSHCDIVNADLPLDSRRSPGYRQVEPPTGNRFYLWISQHG